MKKILSGTGVALITPFKKDLSIDFKALDKLVKYVVDNGVNYLVVQGTTGEAATLSPTEKHAVLSCITDAAENKVPVIVGIGGNNTAEIINTISNFDFSGISAILSVAPYYNKPTQEGLYKHYQEISNNSPVPIILYNVPGRTGVNISAETTLKLANDFDNIIAIKEASGNMSQIMEILNKKPKNFLVISGDDTLTLPLIALGADGVISVTANAFPAQFSQMVKASLKNENSKAKELHYKLLEFTESIFSEGSPGGIKSALKTMNITEEFVRLPLSQVSRNTAKIIKEKITGILN